MPVHPERRSVLAQARLLYTFSHLALQSGEPAFGEAARVARAAVRTFRRDPGLYARTRRADGAPTGNPADAAARSYDQSFVVLELATWGRLHPGEDEDEDEFEACWAALKARLTDPATGLLLEDDGVSEPSDQAAPPRAQNPHMHHYEAALQAFEMTGADRWLTRAGEMRALGLTHFFDEESGTITEFLAPDLSSLPGRDGARREVGHQCEWAWLLMREADLGGPPEVRETAARLLAFTERYGLAEMGAMKGAAFDGVARDGSWREETFLLWPQTELLKVHAVRSDDPKHAQAARALALSMFQRYFADRAVFANQVDAEGRVIWPDALSRLLYHVVLAQTEGARAGLWAEPR